MSHNDSHLMALIDELKQSRNVMDQREVKTLQVIEGLLKRIERLEKAVAHNAQIENRRFLDNQNAMMSRRY